MTIYQCIIEEGLQSALDVYGYNMVYEEMMQLQIINSYSQFLEMVESFINL